MWGDVGAGEQTRHTGEDHFYSYTVDMFKALYTDPSTETRQPLGLGFGIKFVQQLKSKNGEGTCITQIQKDSTTGAMGIKPHHGLKYSNSE